MLLQSGQRPGYSGLFVIGTPCIASIALFGGGMPVKGGKDRHPYPAREADNRGSDGMVRFSLPSESVKFSRLPLKSALVPTEMLSADPLCDFLVPWAKSNHLLLSL